MVVCKRRDCRVDPRVEPEDDEWRGLSELSKVRRAALAARFRQLPALSMRRVVSTFSSQPISISGTDFKSRSV